MDDLKEEAGKIYNKKIREFLTEGNCLKASERFAKKYVGGFVVGRLEVMIKYGKITTDEAQDWYQEILSELD